MPPSGNAPSWLPFATIQLRICISWLVSTGMRAPQMATRIEQISQRVADRSGGRLEPVPRESLVRYPEIFVGLQGWE